MALSAPRDLRGAESGAHLLDDGRVGLQAERFGTDYARAAVGEPVMVLVTVLIRRY